MWSGRRQFGHQAAGNAQPKLGSPLQSRSAVLNIHPGFKPFPHRARLKPCGDVIQDVGCFPPIRETDHVDFRESIRSSYPSPNLFQEETFDKPGRELPNIHGKRFKQLRIYLQEAAKMVPNVLGRIADAQRFRAIPDEP